MAKVRNLKEEKAAKDKLRIHLPREMREQIEVLETATSIVRNACLVKKPPVENNLFHAKQEITSAMAGLAQILCKINFLSDEGE